MITQALIDYVSKQTAAGVSTEAIRHALITQGWQTEDVEAVLNGRTDVPVTPGAVPPPVMSQAEAAAKIKETGRFKASWLLFKQSVHLLKQDKEVVLFPILSSVVALVALILFVAFLMLTGLAERFENDGSISDPVILSIVFAYYIVSAFILTFFRVGLTAVVYERINGGNIGFAEGIRRASGIFGKILVWSVVTATVGIVLRVISERSKWLGKIVAGLLGAAWSIVTFFIAPTLLLDNVSVWQSIKNSGTIFKKTWGETLITTVSLSLISIIAVFGSIFIYIALAILLASIGAGIVTFIILGILCFFTIILISIITTSLGEIFKVALYSYARFGIIAEGFSPEFIIGAVKQKENK